MPTNIFIAFANEDRDVRDRLLRQMNLVKDREGWNIWSSQEIKAGTDWSAEIQERLDDSEVVILLLSTDFFHSKYIRDRELPAMIARHREGRCHIIPVIARECLWKDTDFGDYASMGAIQALPVGEKPIVSKGYWDSEDAPYVQVVTGIKESVRDFQRKKRPTPETPKPRQPTAIWWRWAGSGAVVLMAIWVGWLTTWRGGQSIQDPALAASDTSKIIAPKPDTQIVVKPPQPDTRIAEPKPVFKFDYKMVRVEGGTYAMGSPKTSEEHRLNECQHTVDVASFSIGQTEVTQGHWKSVMGKPSSEIGKDNYPASFVSRNDAEAFIRKLNAKLPNGPKYRLPTEEEWEYAARGGTHGLHDYKRYAGSNNADEVAWYGGNSKGVHPVGTKKSNELGLFDMCGNVEEWCSNEYAPYSNCYREDIDKPLGVLRGGHNGSGGNLCHSSYREREHPTTAHTGTGFRLAHD